MDKHMDDNDKDDSKASMPSPHTTNTSKPGNARNTTSAIETRALMFNEEPLGTSWSPQTMPSQALDDNHVPPPPMPVSMPLKNEPLAQSSSSGSSSQASSQQHQQEHPTGATHSKSNSSVVILKGKRIIQPKNDTTTTTTKTNGSLAASYMAAKYNNNKTSQVPVAGAMRNKRIMMQHAVTHNDTTTARQTLSDKYQTVTTDNNNKTTSQSNNHSTTPTTTMFGTTTTPIMKGHKGNLVTTERYVPQRPGAETIKRSSVQFPQLSPSPALVVDNNEDDHDSEEDMEQGSRNDTTLQQHSEANNDTTVLQVTEATLVDPKERQEEEERIRQETLREIHASTTRAQVVDVHDDMMTERKRRMQLVLWFVCCLAVAIAVSVAVSVSLVMQQNENNGSPPTRTESIRQAVMEEFGSKQDTLEDETTSQYIAIDWMAVNDTLLEFPLQTEAERRAFRQRYVMCVLAFATGIDTWVRQTNWMEPVDECTWSGLTCDDNGELLAINTPSRNLTGTLPTELGYLPKLRFMFVYDNPGLEGSIPSQLGNATSLELLYAQDCSLTGTVPDEFSTLSSLEKLVLSNNQLTGELPLGLTSMINANEIDLSHNNLTGVVLPKFWHLQKLQTLLLNDNALTGPISPNFGDLALLERLELQNNFLTGLLPTQLGNLRVFRVLRVFGNSINAFEVPDQVCSLRRDAPLDGLQVLEINCTEPCRCCTPCSL